MTDPFRIRLLALASVFSISPLYAGSGLDLSRNDVTTFIAMMEREHGIPVEETRGVLSEAQIQPPILEAMRRPAEKVKPWHEYRQIFLTDKRIDAGVQFWRENRSELDRVSGDTGVPPEIIVGILGVETFYGRITGRYRVIDALATLAFEYPPRSRFFTSELEQFLLLAREQGIDPHTATGSYAGAMGGPQFISSSYRAYAVDASGDGRVDLWENWTDIMGSVANYFTAHGWEAGGEVVARIPRDVPANLLSDGLRLDRDLSSLVELGIPSGGAQKVMVFELEAENGPQYWVGYKNFYVITRYNRSNMYAMAVYELGQAVRARREAADSDSG
ncbi:MAG: lytic murein transglycosylase B [Gammaproteobacteria bacterium]